MGIRAFTYSRWDGSQSGFDPDAADIFAELRDDLLEHGDPLYALRRLLNDGFEMDGERIKGIREMLRELRERRKERLENHNLGGIYDDIAKELREVIETERESLDELSQPTRPNNDSSSSDPHSSASQNPDTAQDSQASANPQGDTASRSPDTDSPASDRGNDFHSLAEKQMQLDMLPPDLAGQLRQLENYEFTSPEAQQRFYELLDKLRQQMMENFVQQVTEQTQNLKPEDMSRIKDMLADLNKMLEQRANGEEPDFDSFMEKYGDFFPENPRNLDELLETLARRMAAMQAMLNSMTPEQRAQMSQLAQQLMEDLDFNWQMSQLAQNLQQLFPDAGWDAGYNFSGMDPLDFPEAMQLMQELGDIDQLENLLSNANHPGALADVDIERAKELLGEDAARNLQQLSELAKKLEEEGLIENQDGRYEMTPKAIRRLGQHALADLFSKLTKDRIDGHELREIGQGHERDFFTKPYEWGDPFTLDIQRTVRNAIRRTGGGVPVNLSVDDFEIEQSENLVRSSTVLLLDLSLSMPMRGNFLPAKKVAIALQTLITSKFPRDYLGIVGFSDIAREFPAHELPTVTWEYVHGTNMQHALMLARRMLANQSGFKQVIMVTDGEPTAHITDQGHPYFAYPPTRETVHKTLSEVMRCTREDIRINVFMLDATDYLAHFVEQITKLNGGRAFFTTPGNLGDYVLVDFVEQKRKLLSGRRAA